MTVQRFDPEGMKFDGMSQAVRVGNLVFVSGQVALKDGEVVGIDDASIQAEQSFANIESVLKSAGCSFDNVVKITCYLTDKDAYAGFAQVKSRVFANNPPASTCVIVDDLLLPGLLMEIEVEAYIG